MMVGTGICLFRLGSAWVVLVNCASVAEPIMAYIGIYVPMYRVPILSYLFSFFYNA